MILIGLVVIILSLGISAAMLMILDVGTNFRWLSDFNPIILGGIFYIIQILFGYLCVGGSG